MIMEEYCSYILSREKNSNDFTIPGSNVIVKKNDLINNLKTALRDSDGRDYDGLLLNTLACYISKDYLMKKREFDGNMNAIISNIRERLDSINALNKSAERSFLFSYERIFEILVYYLRLVTNVLKSGKNKKVSYVTAEISPEAVIHVMNHKLSIETIDSEWEKKGWKLLYKDTKPLSAGLVESYLKFMLLATYIRYREIMDK